VTRRARGLAAAAVAMVAVLGAVVACDPDDVPTPGPSTVDVNTPELVEAKKAAGVEDCDPGTGDPVDGGLPAVSLPCFGGGPDVDLASLRGPLVVNLWGSWCGPCRREMPVLAKFYAEHGEQVPMLGIDYADVQTGAAMELVEDSEVRYPLVADPGGELAAHPPFSPRMGLPISVFVDAAGTATVVPGEIDSEQELIDLVEEHLGVRL
jgi:thiol-disulfide isomerase/thioredoxin